MQKKKMVIGEKIGIAVVLIAVLLFSFFMYFPKDCKEDAACFMDKAATCDKANVNYIKEGSTFSYEILGKKDAACLVNVKLEKMSEESNAKTIELLEGKEMFCRIPQDKFANEPLADTKAITDYCTGQLKEGIQTLIIEKLYGLVLANIKGVSAELEQITS